MGCHRTRRRWDHPTYRYAYCVERYGNVYYVLHGGNAKSLGNLIFKEANRKLALNLLDKKIEDYLNTKASLPADVGITTLYELIEDYLSNELSNRPESQQRIIRYAIRATITDDAYLGDILAVRRSIQQGLTRCNDSSQPSTVNKYLSCVSKVFRHYIELDVLQRNPITSDMYRAKNVPIIRYPTLDELRIIVNHISSIDRELSLLIRFLASTGLRITEAMSLWFDNEAAPLISHSDKKSLITDSYMVVDGKRVSNNVPKIRELPIEIFNFSENIINIGAILAELREMNTGRVFSYSKHKFLLDRLYSAYRAIHGQLRHRYSFHCYRKFATNYWEKELGWAGNICAWVAGHTPAVKYANYTDVITGTELVNLLTKKK